MPEFYSDCRFSAASGLSTSPLVSICIPAYRQILKLRKTLDSILAQEFQDFELIVSDDSPDDRVENLLKEYPFGDKLTYWKNNPAKGSPENWNEAIRKAKGEFIKLIHHDDWFTDEISLGKYVQMVQGNPEASFAFSAANSWFEVEQRMEVYNPGQARIEAIRNNPLLLLSANVIGAPSAVIVRKDALQLYDPNLIWLVDIENYIRMIQQNNRFVYTSEPLVTNSADLGDRISGKCIDNREVEVREHFYVYNKHRHSLNAGLKYQHVLHLLGLLSKYNVRSIAEIRSCGFKGEIPAELRPYFIMLPYLGNYARRIVQKGLTMKMKRGGAF